MAGLLATAAPALIQFDADRRILWITDAPSEYPCTMDHVRAASERQGWGCVTYDPAAATYTIAASLWIGGPGGQDTYMQMGRPERPRETWIVHGDVAVYPRVLADGRPRAVHRLTLGNATNPLIRAELKIAGATPAGAARAALPSPYRGDVHVYHSRISPLVEDAAHALGAKEGINRFFFTGGNVALVGAEIAWCNGGFVLTSLTLAEPIQNTVFAHLADGINYWDKAGNLNSKPIIGCTFRDCGTAIRPILRVALHECVFQGNDRNWVIENNLDTLQLIDCRVDPPRGTNRHERARSAEWASLVVARNHVRVRVRDARDQPVARAAVRCAPDGNANAALSATTDAAGCTGGRGAAEALLLTAWTETATDDPLRPRVTPLTYTVRVTAPGFDEGRSDPFTPDAPWREVVVRLRPAPAPAPQAGRVTRNPDGS